MDHDLALLGRVALAAVLGFGVGWERGDALAVKPAGQRRRKQDGGHHATSDTVRFSRTAWR